MYPRRRAGTAPAACGCRGRAPGAPDPCAGRPFFINTLGHTHTHTHTALGRLASSGRGPWTVLGCAGAADRPVIAFGLRRSSADRQVYAIGKVSDIYATRGITHKIKASGNMVLFDRTLEAMDMATDGALIFTNFVDFDTEFGHRRDPGGYADALEQFDRRLPELIAKLRDDDLLVITADHGNDPTWPGTDHTREQVPILLFSRGLGKASIGLRPVLSDIGETIAHWLGIAPGKHGTSAL